MFAVPDETVHRTKVADWLELKAIASAGGRIGFGTLVSGTALTENEQEENIADEDIAEEDLACSVCKTKLREEATTWWERLSVQDRRQGSRLAVRHPVSKVGRFICSACFCPMRLIARSCRRSSRRK